MDNQLVLYNARKPMEGVPTFLSVKLFLLVLSYIVARKIIKIPNFKKKTSVKTSSSKLKKELGIDLKASLKTLDTVAVVLLFVLAPMALYNLSTRYLLPPIMSSKTLVSPDKWKEYQNLSKLHTYSLVYYINKKDTNSIDKIIENSDKTLINLLLQQIEINILGGVERMGDVDWALYNKVYQKYSRACRLKKGDCTRILDIKLHPDRGGDSREFKTAMLMIQIMRELYA